MAKRTFENALSKLEQITQELEDGDLSLEKSLKKFDEGIGLVEYCNKTLTEAKAKVELLLEKQGGIATTPFDELDNGDQELP
ncbi:MAG TPA: exodeoxyribonuclease VII small subunit [Desulfocapsa sulfexigens]|nr:exodeoxyribonuclease VII small subunit [Desulfocapsa sulfexigens]